MVMLEMGRVHTIAGMLVNKEGFSIGANFY